MDEYGLSVSHFYSSISDHELLRVMKYIYSSFPNCGYRMMATSTWNKSFTSSYSKFYSLC